MKSPKWMIGCVVGLFLFTGPYALAQGNGNGNGNGHGNGQGHGKGHNKHGEDDEDRGDYYYRGHEREIRQWYEGRHDDLPPGLAKKDRLPPGLERQLVRRGTLPPGLQKRIQPCPPDLERYLPPPPPETSHVLIGGHIVLLNRRTNVIVDILHFERY